MQLFPMYLWLPVFPHLLRRWRNRDDGGIGYWYATIMSEIFWGGHFQLSPCIEPNCREESAKRLQPLREVFVGLRRFLRLQSAFAFLS